MGQVWNPREHLLQHQTSLGLAHLTKRFHVLRKWHKIFSKLRDIPFCFNLKMGPSCQTLSNAFDMSRKAPLTSNPSSKDFMVYAGVTGFKSRLMSSFSIKNLNISLKINFSSIFPQIGSREIGI